MAVQKNCQDCPSYLLADAPELRDRFGRPTGGPMCGRFGHVLGSSHSQPADLEQIGLTMAPQCEGFGQPMPDDLLYSHPSYGGPIVAVPADMTSPNVCDTSVRSCNSCLHSVGAEPVYAELGWALPVCKVFGKLILKPVAEARECNYRFGGPADSSTNDINLIEMLREGYRIPTEEAIKQYISQVDFIDPKDYLTDVPVTREDELAGVGAWRRIFDPEGTGRFCDLPIMKADHYTEEMRGLIPQTHDGGNPELYIDYNNLLFQAAVEWSLRETPALVGEPGTGKTQFGRYLAWLCQMPFIRVQFQRDMDVEDLLGSPQLKDGETFFEPGQLPIAWMNDVVLVADEPNLGPDAAWQVMRPITDNSKELKIGNMIFPRGRFNIFLMAMNPSWDARNIGANQLADADGNRLSFLSVERPPEPVERHIIKTYCMELDGYEIPDSTVDVIIAAGNDIRALAESGEFPGSWATRQSIKVARKTAWYPIPQAFKVAALNNLDPETVEAVLNLINTLVESPSSQYIDPPFNKRDSFRS